MELVLEYVMRGIADVFTTSSGAFDWMPLVMVVAGLFVGIIVGATPGLNGPFAMALSLPVLIWVFGVSDDALLPILGFLIGLMKGATVGGAVGPRRVPGHTDHQTAIVTPVGRPPVLAVGHQRFDVGLHFVEVELRKFGSVVEVRAVGVRFRTVLAQRGQVEAFRPPVLVGHRLCIGCAFGSSHVIFFVVVRLRGHRKRKRRQRHRERGEHRDRVFFHVLPF